MSDKIAGYIYFDGIEAGETLQCCHCGAHFIRRVGSGIIRGYCLKCCKSTCGKKECNFCYPFEKRLVDNKI